MKWGKTVEKTSASVMHMAKKKYLLNSSIFAISTLYATVERTPAKRKEKKT